jgi:hypothetical protein
MTNIELMENKLTEGDKRFLKAIYSPTVVATPPADACKHVVLMPDGEIRIYGFAERTHPDEVVDRVYIASNDCGLSWKKHLVKPQVLGAATCNPSSGRWITYYPDKDYEDKPDGYPNDSYCYAVMNDDGPDAPPKKFVQLSEEYFHFQKQPYYINSIKRWIFAVEVRRNDRTHDFYKTIGIAYSDDDGESWKVYVLPEHAPKHEVIPPHKGVRWQDYSCEPTIVELSDGTLYMLERTSQDFHYERFSYDGGITWTEPQPSVFHGTLTMPVLYKLQDGRILHFWCNTQPLPELDHQTQWPPLSQGEKTGRWEDVFTNRDANHLAISEDDGKSWIGFRELFLNGLRNRADFRSIGGVDSRDKSVHQGEMLELPYNKLLVSFGQNAVARKVVLLDIAWLYEKKRSENFALGMESITTHMYVKSNSGGYRGFSGHCAWNRTNGALLAQDPDGNFEEALQIARVHDKRLIYEKQGCVWNFPASKNGEIYLRLRVENSGVRICLADHWYNACDETIACCAPAYFDTETLTKHVWHEVCISFDTKKNQATMSVDGKMIISGIITGTIPYGFCYLHIQTLAEKEDFEGTYIKNIRFAEKRRYK